MPLRCEILLLRVILVIESQFKEGQPNLLLKSDDIYLIRLCEFCLLSSEDKRFIADVVFVYKVINNGN